MFFQLKFNLIMEPIDYHYCKTHDKLWVERNLIKVLNNDDVIAMDIEYVTNTYTKQNLTFRVVASVNFSRGTNNMRIIYHSLWYPNVDQYRANKFFYGASKEQIEFARKDWKYITDRNIGLRTLKSEVINARKLVFCCAQGDLKSTARNHSENYYDIQWYFVRNAEEDSFGRRQPVSLKTLSKIILNHDIQRNIHDPIIDLRETFLLYKKVPPGFWQNGYREKSSSSTKIYLAIDKSSEVEELIFPDKN